MNLNIIVTTNQRIMPHLPLFQRRHLHLFLQLEIIILFCSSSSLAQQFNVLPQQQTRHSNNASNNSQWLHSQLVFRTENFEEETKTQSGTPTTTTTTTTTTTVGAAVANEQQFSLDDFAHALRIEKDQQDPSRLLDVFLPTGQQSTGPAGTPPIVGPFRQFIARVADISAVDESRSRDANRTFLASLADSSVINVHGLNPGHKYQVAILGRREAESLLIREDQVLMDPVPLDFGIAGNSSAILATQHNITMRAQKPERALQDTFRVEYHQLDPLKRYPILDVHDIQEQREVELYLGNLSPGRDYAISVTSLREDLPSPPWRGIVTTRPLRPTNLTVLELNTSCVLFEWHLPVESGADRFKVAYGMLHGPQSMQKLETDYPVQQVPFCPPQIVPGRVFIFAVIAEKNRQISEPATISHTIRPLPPRELVVEPDFERASFRVRAMLPPEQESHSDKCQIVVQSEEEDAQGETPKQEQSTMPVVGVVVQSSGAAGGGEGGAGGGEQQQQQCEAHFELVPGRRYEISATALSGQSTASIRVLRNRAVEPGFDFTAFGLTLREEGADEGSGAAGGIGTLRLEWPQSEVARLRIADLWARIVGRDSHLHFSVQPLDSAGPTSQLETGPTEPGPVLVEGVHEGECYKVLLYTVTASGIVSEKRTEQYLRTKPPRLDLAVGQLSARSATLQAFLFRSSAVAAKRPNQTTTNASSLSSSSSHPSISPQCQLKVLVSEAYTGEVLLERHLPLAGQPSPSVALEGLRPWRKYAANAQVICGPMLKNFSSSSPSSTAASPCPANMHTLGRVEFRTEPAPPGAVFNFTALPMNAYSAHLRWQAPEEPNGRISHYIVQIEPEPYNSNKNNDNANDVELSEEELRPWTERVPHSAAAAAATMDEESGGGTPELLVDGSESLLPAGQQIQLEKVLDGLAGGRRYRLELWAVNEAGQGRGSGQLTVEMPIQAPPAPARTVLQVLPGTVRSQQLMVRMELAQLSERNGPLMKLALVVAETDEQGEVPPEAAGRSELVVEADGGGGMLPTWAMARRLVARWPPYVALEVMPNHRTHRFGAIPLEQTVGTEADCADKVASQICNGPLKPGAIYRLKLRLFTAPHLWTDSLWTEPVHLEPPAADSTLGQALFLVFVCCLLVGIGTALLVAHRRRKNCHKGGSSGSNKSKSSFCRGIINSNSSSSSGPYHQHQQQQHSHHQHRAADLQQRRREGQWHALKMIMAERAADCLAKLGLDPAPAGSASATNTIQQQQPSTSCSSSSVSSTSSSSIANSSNNSSHPHHHYQHHQNNNIGTGAEAPLHGVVNNNIANNATLPPLSSSSSPYALARQQQQQQSAATATTHHGNVVLCAAAVGQPNSTGTGSAAACAGGAGQLFGAPHHRRSKSLRERTGVDQRLERLPSGPPPGHRHTVLPWTVLKVAQPERSRPVQICDFVDHVRLMSADSDFRFSEEYEDLRIIGLGQSCVAADLTANRAKNRFTNILPYDHSRVKLKPTDDEDGSDYVNASYIPGFSSRREFIAAQGPLPSTRDHFWRLVWEQQVPAIVALTKCVEKGRDKCHQYWPDNSQRSVLYADIEVTLLTESIDYEEFTVRELRLTNLSEPGQPHRTVQHLHYQAWPDFGVPAHPGGIVHFARLFRNKLPPNAANKPTIVHCSAGVGRSGTFIALDRLVQHIECGKPIDVFGTVHEMRIKRCHMVQNEQQYIFIHQCLQYVLENFYPYLLSPSSQQQQQSGANVVVARSSSQHHMPFGSSISSPIGGGIGTPNAYSNSSSGISSSNTNTNNFMMHSNTSNASNDNVVDDDTNDVTMMVLQQTGSPPQHAPIFTMPPTNAGFAWTTTATNTAAAMARSHFLPSSLWSAAGPAPPKIEVHQHQNEGFLVDDDDEGIAESGL